MMVHKSLKKNKHLAYTDAFLITEILHKKQTVESLEKNKTE
jgi:hypothetical protein